VKITAELIAVPLPQFGDADSKVLDLADGADVLDALDAIGLDSGTTFLVMVNGQAVHRSEWSGYALKGDDTLSLFRPFKGG
jgi:thiamine biosynthesis protein ThiS